MRVTVLGKSPAWQDANGACSGYLVQDGLTTVLLECGNGVFGKLRAVHDYTRVDTVVVSHMHSDHFFDLIPYAFALIYSPRQQPVEVDRWPGTSHPARPTLYLPIGGIEVLRKVVGAFHDERLVEQAFIVVEYSPTDVLNLTDMEARFRPVPHFVPTNAIEFGNEAGKRFTFGADCRPSTELVEFASGTDLLMLEATLPRPERHGNRGHLTPSEAGEHAAKANAGGLVLTHTSDELDELWVLSQAQKQFDGTISIAHPGAVYSVG